MYLFLSTSSATTLAQVTSCPTWPSKVIPKLVLSLEFILQPSATVRFPESCPHLLTPLTQCMLFLQTFYRPHEHLSSHRCHLKMTRPKDTLRVLSDLSLLVTTPEPFPSFWITAFTIFPRSSSPFPLITIGMLVTPWALLTLCIFKWTVTYFYFHHLQCHREAGLPHSSL